MAKKKLGEEVLEVLETKYTKEQLILSEQYKNDRDLISAILEDGKYTKEEVDEILQKWKGEKAC